ncbi:MAG: TolC family protein, partial [candidate division WOR-3 bacterium]
MKKIIFIIFFMLISSISVAEVFTLTDCINLAKEHNLELQQARLSIANARAAASEARAQFYPSLGVSSSYRLSGDFSGNNNYQGNFSNGVNASYNLYKGGAIRASAKIADYRLAIAQENYRQKEAEVILAVKQAFYKILQIQQQIDLIKQVLQRRHENLVLIKLNYNVGRENQANVAQAEANLSQSEYDYWKA